eukprot:2920579-Rhodomonas_salina.1
MGCRGGQEPRAKAETAKERRAHLLQERAAENALLHVHSKVFYLAMGCALKSQGGKYNMGTAEGRSNIQ